MPKKYLTTFPTTQAEMAEWQKKYKYDPTVKKWYEEIAEVPEVPGAPMVPPTEGVPGATPTPTPAPTGGTYAIQSGDTLSAIAMKQGTTVQVLMAANPQIKDPNMIYEGQSLTLPQKAPAIEPGAPEVIPEKKPPIIPEKEEAILTDESKIQQLIAKAAELGMEYPADIIEQLTKAPEEAEEEIRTKLYEKYGIEDLETKFKEKPELTFEEIYSSAYSDLGLADLKEEINDIRKKIAKAEENRDEAIGEINENPWLPEASRVGRVKRLWDRSQRELDRLQNQLTLIDTLYTRGKEEAENVATRALNTFVREREWTKEELAYYVERAELDLEAKLKARGVEAEREKWRYFPEYLESLKPEKDLLSVAEAKSLGVPYGTTREQATRMGITPTGEGVGGITIGSVLGLDKSLASKFDTDLEQEIKAVYSGKYGVEGSRERALKNLQAKYPGIADSIAEIVYGSERFNAAFPNGYEAEIQGKEPKREFTPTQREEIVKAYIAQIGKDEARATINAGTIVVNGKEIKLTDGQKKIFLELIEKQEEGGEWYWPESILGPAPF